MDADVVFANHLASLCDRCETRFKNDGFDLCQSCYKEIYEDSDEYELPENATFEQITEYEERQNRNYPCTFHLNKTPLTASFQAKGTMTQETCTICLDTFEEDTAITSLSCAHVFHAHCIQAWFDTKLTCPVCLHDATK